MTARIILTAAEMRAAEAAAIDAGTPVEALMERAGIGAAKAIWSHCGPGEALVLCGPGNNGGDGYVIACELRARGMQVRVAASGAPASPAARAAQAAWAGPVEPIEEAKSAPLLIDALFGTGLSRPLDASLADRLAALATAADVRVAIDLPSGAATDDGRLHAPVADFHLTITFQTLKPSHLLQPAARHMGRIVIVDLGLAAASLLHEIARPRLRGPGPEDHKYTRGYVAILGGEMPGAAALAAASALRAGAGYVRLFAPESVPNVPSAVVQTPGTAFVADPRIGALLVGPGLGRGEQAKSLFDQARASGLPLVVDGDALGLLAESGPARFDQPAILTPHQGEFLRLFGASDASKVDQARSAARDTDAIILLKGADTVVAAPDGRAAIAAPAPHWLASAGTGDVLAGIVASRLAAGDDPFDAACAGAWMHHRAAALAGPGLIADDLVARLPATIAETL